MPKGKKPGPSVKKPDTYEKLKEKGYSKERAAKISNAQAKQPKKTAQKAASTRKAKSSGGKKGGKKS